MNEEMKRLFAGAESDLAATDPEWVRIVSDFSQNEVPEGTMLTAKERYLCILAALLGCQGKGEFENMLHAALNDGIDPVAIRETIYQATAYLGIGRVHDFLTAANKVMVQHNITLPLPDQSTTNQDTRFDAGLAKQVAYFGPGMAARQNDKTSPRSKVNRWLADNCFGDYYTRNGLNDAEREMITFCFILAQGGCENQLRGHAAGNMNVGNSAEKLYAMVEQCMPYIGYPRTLNAMGIIDEVVRKA